MNARQSAIDYEAIKIRQRSTWSSADYTVVGATLQITGEQLCETLDVAAGERVLDVASGSGNAALAAARRGAVVTASDYVTGMLDRTRTRAIAEHLTVALREADAEALPFADGAFDVVLSTFGAMFTPRQERAMSELLRVCRPGGRVGLTTWTPDGFVGRMFTVIGRYVPPPAGLRSPLEWGTKQRVGELFGTAVDSIGAHPRQFVFRYRSTRAWLETFREHYGPLRTSFAALDSVQRSALELDLLALADAHNTSGGTALRIPSEYLEVFAVKARAARAA